ncbi:MAG: hypothetical protein ACFCU6_00480 [Balneolaceae bacterium]
MLRTCFLFLFTFYIVSGVHAQRPDQIRDIPEVYIDCSSCDLTNIRTNITFVNYTTNPEEADILLKIEDLRISGGGREFILKFTGLKQFEGISDTLRHISPGGESENERRTGLNRMIKIGLMPYVSKTVAINHIDIFYDPGEPVPAEPDPDPEKPEELPKKEPGENWLFDLNARASLSGERTRRNVAVFGNFEAENITEVQKIRVRLRGEDVRNRIETSSGIRNVNRSWGEITGMQIFSFNDHAAIGFFEKTSFSTFNNVKFNIEASPAFEFNFFSFAQYSRQRLIMRYRITPSFRIYDERTIFNKTSEFIGQQNLTFDFRIDRSWGRIRTEISGSQFFQDLSLNRLEVDNTVNFRILRGFSVSISGRYSLINDQIAVRAGDVSDEEALLDLRRRATSEAYGISLGISYTFGALSSRAVNRRF